MKTLRAHTLLFVLLLLTAAGTAHAQRGLDAIRGMGSRIGGGGSGSGSDSLRNRSQYEDSLTVKIYYLDSTGVYHLDSSILDFTKRFPIPATHVYIGNTGSATHSLLFSPRLKAGWDPGFHAYDAYKWTLDKVRFFNVTRPYTELNYQIASRSEQIIELLVTENLRPTWNVSFNYRLINAPGVFKNQETNHNNYLFNSWYQSVNRRYNNYFVLLGNRLQAAENGGIKDVKDLDRIEYAKDRFLVPTQIGGDPVYSTDFFSTSLNTGNRYREFTTFLRQQYDFGRKDSIVTDSTVIPLFYPRIRFEHDFTLSTYNEAYRDFYAAESRKTNTPDSTWYRDHYDVAVPSNDSIMFNDRWREITNDFSVYQFPDAKNLQQYFKVGAALQLLSGRFIKDSGAANTSSLFNVYGHATYRNKTRNKKWDMLADGRLYLNGYNLGDYQAYVSLQRQLGNRFGSLQVGFENASQKAPFIYDQRSGFYLDAPKSFNKQNITHLFGGLDLQRLGIHFGADYYLVGNYLYLTDFYKLQQEKTLFNVLRLNALKTFRLGKHWNWHAEIYLQQKTGTAQLNIPAVFTRNRLFYEGKLGFRNLNIAFGVEAKYHTPYQADNYSPVLGRFFYQNQITISNRPDVAAIMHFRIRSFKAYFRLENLNTARFYGGFQFNNNNLAAPNYPTPGLLMRFGIYWSFVN